MTERTCSTPGCGHPHYCLHRCRGCYKRFKAGKPPEPWRPRPKFAPIIPPSGAAKECDLERIRGIAEAEARTAGLKPNERAVLNYALTVALNMGSEKFEIPHAARDLGLVHASVNRAAEQLVELGWLEVVERESGLGARFKLHVGQGREPQVPCSWPGCRAKSTYEDGLCWSCYVRIQSRTTTRRVLHKLRNVNLAALTADCQSCGAITGVIIGKTQGKPRGICPAVVRGNKISRIARKYGLTVEQYMTMITQQRGRCAICNEIDSLNVDHDHKFGSVRGLLCNRCNLAIGLLRDSPLIARAATKYLEGHAQQALPI